MKESTWTPPTDLCPNPERWTARDIDATEYEVLELIGSLVRALQPDVCVETGTYLGDGTRAIAAALERNGHGHVHTFETDERNVAAAAADLTDLAHRVTFHHREVGDWEPPGPLDFAFFDSSFGARKIEYVHLSRWMTPRTVVVFHDTAPHHPMRALLDDVPITLIDLPTPRGVSIGQLPR